MKKSIAFLLTMCFSPLASAGLITAVPGPDDQGGMIMPMVKIQATSGPATNPTSGNVMVTLGSHTPPVLKSLNEWSPGDWFADTAAWRQDLSPVAGSVSGMPVANSGNGSLFNNQYGFMFMANGTPMMANVPSGNALAIKLTALSSAELLAFNYVNAQNRWDKVFDGVNSQVLWNGSMWHNYFVMPANTPAGNYTATFEIFIASTPFTGSTGFAQYDAAALSASKNPNFGSAFVTYNFQVVPEPSTWLPASLAGFALILRRLRKKIQ